ncbi:MAG: S9 family peptidase [Chloroflexi bacterium]|nr:S9 family peptidase [Chloroflexota bacterium]
MPLPKKPYGSWKSPITSELIVAESVGLGQVHLDGDDVYWSEMRPSEGGRNVVVRRTPDGRTSDVTPPPFNARTRVHEYGGGAFVVSEAVVYFSNFADQRLYRQEPGGEPQPLTPEAELRYADGVIDRQRRRMVCVREDHTGGGEAVNTIVGLDLEHGGPGDVLVSGDDFYSSPRLAPDGSRLAWLAWDHPNMPWDGTELRVAEVKSDGSLGEAELVAGGVDESIFQPEWSPDGVLHFVSDRTGWWNLYRWRDGRVETLQQMEAEFGVPQWGLGMSTYGFASPKLIICSYNRDGMSHIADLDTETLELKTVPTPFTETTRSGLRVGADRVVFGAGSPTMPESLMLHDLRAGTTVTLRRSTEISLDEGYLSKPRPIEFPTEGGLTAHAFFYPPCNRDYEGPPDERPPLLVGSHGGPTGAASTTLDPQVQFWTSRGFAVLDVNYGGSTGYGTAYRRRLNGRWGIVDVDDCVNGARYLAERGEVDGERMAIRGGSAGGYTTLAALTFRDVFKAGASHYGISDLEAMARDTHKFESRYLDTLIGPYPERRDLYVERSPIHHTDRLSSPLILFQGLEDEIVPPNQAEMMRDALRDKGLPVAYVAFEGEQHGFRKAENIRRALDGELYFYSRVFGFDLADPVEPVPIENRQ